MKDYDKVEIEHSILSKDIQALTSQLVSEHSGITTSTNSQSELNKTFSSLVNVMRKATRIITVLDKKVKDLSDSMNN